MKTFLGQIAEQYYTAFGNEISNICFVFPNKRAGLFFKKELAELVQNEPIFMPQTLSINNLVKDYSDIEESDTITLNFLLYSVFQRVTKNNESFDTFFPFGETLLRDFNEIDTYMVDAKQIFTHIADLKEIDTAFDYLNEEQIAIIRHFWQHFLPNDDKIIKRNFLKIWQSLLEIYTQFHALLEHEKVGYAGLILRQVAEKMRQGNDFECPYKKVVFVGFNALNPVEKTVMNYFKKRLNADFYFDYESPFLNSDRDFVSKYIEKNRRDFPSQFELSANEKIDHNIEVVAVASTIGQAKEIYHILNERLTENNDDENLVKTAVVLPDEQLLLPLLHSIPEPIKKINVTMGFPLAQTSIAAFVLKILNVQKALKRNKSSETYYYKAVLELLCHPYVQLAAETEARELKQKIENENLFRVPQELLENGDFLTLLFQKCTDADQTIRYFLSILDFLENCVPTEQAIDHEFIYEFRRAVNLLQLNIAKLHIELQIETIFMLLKRLIASLRVTFEGEPLAGLQVMGVLEARLLDFDTVIIPSFNDDFLPKKQTANPLIPYEIRKVFELPTYEDSDAVFSYNFYRLIHRAKNIVLIYEKRQKSPISRYYYQLKYLYEKAMTERTIAYEISTARKTPISVDKSGQTSDILNQFFMPQTPRKNLSASALNDYISCPLKFYFSRILGLNEEDEMSEIVESNTFGTIYHEVMQKLYLPHKGKQMTRELLAEIKKNDLQIETFLHEAFARHYFKRPEKRVELSGYSLLISRMIKRYIIKTIDFDIRRTPFVVVDCEQTILSEIALADGRKVNVKAVIDRIDEKDGVMQIIDYKTGFVTENLKFSDISKLFETKKNRPKEIFQTLLYSMIYAKKTAKEICPNIFALQKLSSNFTGKIQFGNQNGITYSSVSEEFEAELRQLLGKLFDPSVPFVQTDDIKNCEFCSFKKMCNK